MNAPITKTWIDRKLSRNERKALVDYILERTTSPTGEQILDAIAELFPNKTPPSLRVVNDWKARCWKFELYLRQLECDNSAARLISEASGDIADANKKMVDGYVFGELQKLREGDLENLDPKILSWIQAASQLARRTVDDKKLSADLEKSRAQVEVLKSKVEAYDRLAADWQRKEAERKAALAAIGEKSVGKKITPEFIEEVQRTMGLK